MNLLYLLNELTLLVPDVGEAEMLARMLNKNTPDDCIVKLYTNDKTPAEGDVVGDYTEVSGYGYTNITLTGSNWSIATVAGVTTATYPEQTFSFSSGPVNIYGYYITNTAGTILLWAERFDSAPYNVPIGGTNLKANPIISLD